MTGLIFDIKEMALHDGPGLRTTVFLKGCPLRCKWCHNPEGLSFLPELTFRASACKACGACRGECSHKECRLVGRCIHACPENCLGIAGRRVSPKELARELKSSAKVLGEGFGGFTFSGGEPLAQPSFLLELMEELEGYHLCAETSGHCDGETFNLITEWLDLVIMDIKIADTESHKRYTGVGNELILSNLERLKSSGKPYIIRTPLIPDITDTEENLSAIRELIGKCPWEKLPYNELAGAKYPLLGKRYSLFD